MDKGIDTDTRQLRFQCTVHAIKEFRVITGNFPGPITVKYQFHVHVHVSVRVLAASMDMQHVHVHAACPRTCSIFMSMSTLLFLSADPWLLAWPCPCCMSMPHFHVHGVCPCSCRVSVFMPRVRVHAACPCPWRMSKFMLHFHVPAAFLCPCCMSVSMLHEVLRISNDFFAYPDPCENLIRIPDLGNCSRQNASGRDLINIFSVN